MNENFEIIRNDGRLLYEYIRGSHLYGLNTPDSDVDTSGVFISTKEQLLGCFGYKPQVSDTRHDTTWFEVGELVRLLLKSNPTVLESLFVPEDKILVKPSPLLADLFANKNEFITKQCFNPFIGYAIDQIKKARGLNKKITNPVYERLTPFDFAYTFYKQGSTKISDWLENRGLNKDFCGLVHIPNMHDTYGVYYDWGAHFEANNIKTFDDFISKNIRTANFAMDFYGAMFCENWFEENKDVKHYRGMCLENSTDMRGSSVSKGEKPIVYMVYNESGYKDHCRKYKEYKEWEKNRNPKRYESNLDKNYDSKNLCHTMRLVHMGYEIATGQGIILDREKAGDKEFLMNIRNHKYEYDELMEIVEADKVKLDKAIANSTIKEKIDTDLVNDVLINIRKKAYGML
jgi:predicted nucleotidyltransferase